jgi:tryptophan synthase beta chain
MTVNNRAITLDKEGLPKVWYNILPDLPEPLPPPLDPENRKPLSPEKLEAIFPRELIKQEVSEERFIAIPEEVREVYMSWRPTPLFRAIYLERKLKTPAKIYYKYEGVSPPGSHKPNTAVAQAYYNMREGIERLTTETGAGQWGSALAYATHQFGLKSKIFMVKVSYHQKPFRKVLMNLWGAEVVPSPSNDTPIGKQILKEEPDNPGSLGIAISEAIYEAATNEDTKYSLGSVLNHVLLHQTIIGLEAKRQLESIDEYPDYVVGAVGGGSNFSGIFWPFYYDRVSGKADNDTRFIAVEPLACPTLTNGIYAYDFGDAARMTPLLKMYTLGHNFIPPPIHAGGLRYHGDAPTLCLLVKKGYVDAVAYDQVEVFEAAQMFFETEGILSAPECAHAIKAAIDIALEAKKSGEERVILFNLSGHGYFDMKAYEDYVEKRLPPYIYPVDKIKDNINALIKDGKLLL